MELFRIETGEDASPRRVPVTHAVIQEDIKQALIFFLEDPAQEGRYQTVVVEDDPDLFREGQMRIFNLGENALAMRLAGEKVVIPGGEFRNVDIEASESGNVEVLAARQEGTGEGNWKLIYSTTWGLARGDRSVVFLRPHGQSISVDRFPENVPFVRSMQRRLQNQLEQKDRIESGR